jgi:hypothetical protein
MGMAKFDGSSIPDTLGKIKIERIKENSKKNREIVQRVIQQVDHVDLQMVNDLLVKPGLQHQVFKINYHKKVFAFELNANVKPSKFVVAYWNCMLN